MTCPKCGKPMWGVQYCGTSEDYDGVSEWACRAGCGYRIGRWTNRELVGAEIEKRHGLARLPLHDHEREG